MAPGESRTKLDFATYGARTWWDDLGVFNCGYEWREAANQIVATVKTILFPAIVWATLLQTVFGITMGATGQAVSFALLGAGFVIPLLLPSSSKTFPSFFGLLTDVRAIKVSPSSSPV